jgi:hypothetical protein
VAADSGIVRFGCRDVDISSKESGASGAGGDVRSITVDDQPGGDRFNTGAREHAQQQLYSGKHKTTGLNVQVACDLNGRLAWISDPADGCRHDSAALACSGVVDTLDPGNWIGDKGYVGNDMITPIKKPPYRDLLDWEKEFNTAVNKIRYLIEQTIANLKTWRILHTDYRRPLATFATTISTVIALHFYAIS